MQYFSTRGIPLAVAADADWRRPFIAVESYGKWNGAYLVGAYLVEPDAEGGSATVTQWHPDPKAVAALEREGEWVFADHIWNPKHLRNLIPDGVHMDPISWELVVGRYCHATHAMERAFPEFQLP